MLVSTHYMGEAERCHRIGYISYGKLLARGTVEEVVAGAGLSTFVAKGTSAAMATRIAGLPGVDQVAPFGLTLHVVGRDGAALARSVARVAAETGTRAEPAETSLEDVFIRLMSVAEDTMA